MWLLHMQHTIYGIIANNDNLEPFSYLYKYYSKLSFGKLAAVPGISKLKEEQSIFLSILCLQTEPETCPTFLYQITTFSRVSKITVALGRKHRMQEEPLVR